MDYSFWGLWSHDAVRNVQAIAGQSTAARTAAQESQARFNPQFGRFSSHERR